MRTHALSFGFVLVILGSTFFTGVTIQGDTVVVVPAYGYISNLEDTGQIQALDPNFFSNQSTRNYSTSLSGKSRYYGSDLPYNARDRKEWMKECAPEKDKGMSFFRECFAKKNESAEKSRDAEFAEVQRKQSEPLRNIWPNLDGK